MSNIFDKVYQTYNDLKKKAQPITQNVQKAWSAPIKVAQPIAKASNFINQGFNRVVSQPVSYYTPLSMRSQAVPVAQQFFRNPIINQPKLAEPVGYTLRGALGTTPLTGGWGTQKFVGKDQYKATTPLQKKYEQQGAKGMKTAYGLAATMGAPGGLSLLGQGALLGGGIKAAGNIYNKQPVLKGTAGAMVEGASKGWQLYFTNKVTDKIASKLFPTLTNQAMGKAFKLAGNPLMRDARTKLILNGIKQNFGRALLETPIEASFYTLLDRLNPELKEKITETISRNLLGSLVGNVAFSGLNSTIQSGGALTVEQRKQLGNLFKKQVNQAMDMLKREEGFIRLGKAPAEVKIKGQLSQPQTQVMKVFGEDALPMTKQKLQERGNEIISVNKVKDSRGEIVYNVKFKPMSQPQTGGGGEVRIKATTDQPKMTQQEMQIPRKKATGVLPESTDLTAESVAGGGSKGSSSKPIIPQVSNPEDPFYNIERLNIAPDKKQILKDKITGEFKPTFEEVEGKPMSSDEIVKRAKVTSDEIINVIGRQRTEDLGAAQLRLRQAIAQMVNDGQVDKSLLEKIKADKAFSTNTARLLQQRTINADPLSPNGKLLQKMLDNILTVNDDIDAILAKAKDVDFTDTKEAAGFYRSFIKPTAGDWIDKLRYNSMLTAPTTHIVNATSNYTGTGILTPIQKTIEGGIDATLSFLNPNRQRTRFAGEGVEYVKGYYSEVKNAYKNLMNSLSGKTLNEHPDLNNIPLATKGVPAKVESLLDVGGRALEAVDQFFKTLTMGGLEKSGTYRASRLGVEPGADLTAKASQEAEELLFRGDLYKKGNGVISNLIGATGEKVKGFQYSKSNTLRWMAKLTLPFIKIGTNLAKSGFEHNPLTGTINMIGNDDKIAQAAKVMIGSAVAAIAVPLALSDRLTFAPSPTNTKRGKLQRGANVPSYSIKVPTLNGDKWVSYSKMHPAISWQLAMVSALTEAVKDKRITETNAESLMNGAWEWLRFGLDQTYYRNVSDLINGLNGDFDRFSSIPANFISQFIPFRAFVSWLNRAIDTTQRMPDTSKSFVTQTVQQLMSRLPGFSKMVPARTDEQGNPLKYTNSIPNMFSPYTITTENQPQADEYRDFVKTQRELAPIKQQSDIEKEGRNQIWYDIQNKPASEQRAVIKQHLQDGTLTTEQFKAEIWPKIKEQITNPGGANPAEELVKGASVADEAQYYYNQQEKMGRTQWKAHLKDLYQRKVITKDTLKQIIKLDMGQ